VAAPPLVNVAEKFQERDCGAWGEVWWFGGHGDADRRLAPRPCGACRIVGGFVRPALAHR
jgi:hypothetical protein